MKRLAIVLALVCLVGLFWGEAWGVSPEARDKVITAASKNVVQIGLTYRGDQIHFFGVNPVPGADVITRLTAEKEEAIKLSMKGKVGPFWMTVKQYEVSGSPFIYKIHANKPIKEIISDDTARELEIGYPAIKHKMKMHLVRGKAEPGDEDKVFEGLVHIKESENLYNIVEDPARLQIAEGTLFKHYFRFPAKATEGSYQVETLAFKQGELVGYGKDVIKIQKVGLESWLTKTSQESPVFYGILAVLIAMGAGLGVGMIFRKGGHH
jgi:uncharacterized protein (TIGR02186 family)